MLQNKSPLIAKKSSFEFESLGIARSESQELVESLMGLIRLTCVDDIFDLFNV